MIDCELGFGPGHYGWGVVVISALARRTPWTWLTPRERINFILFWFHAGNFSGAKRQSNDGQQVDRNDREGMTEAVTEDAALAEALAGGNIQAARELYRRHCHPIMRFAMAMTGSRAAAEDIVHDTFVELLHRPGAYNSSRGSLRAFLYGIARHRIANSVRGAVVAPAPGLTLDEEAQGRPSICETAELAAMGGTPDELAEHAQDIECLRTAIKALPLTYREVLVWYDLEELPYAAIADMLDCPIGTVRSRLHRARALLLAAFRSPPQSTAESEPDSCKDDSSVPSCTYRDRVLGGGPA